MKLLLLLFLATFSFHSSITDKNVSSKLNFDASILKQTRDKISVKTVLTNKTNDTIRYLTMSCEWQIVYRRDNIVWNLIYEDCLKNIPVIISIPPHKTEERIIQLVKNTAITPLQNSNFRLGFNFIKAENNLDIESRFVMLENTKNVIWSDALLVR